jgi:hypothetical protein
MDDVAAVGGTLRALDQIGMLEQACITW